VTARGRPPAGDAPRGGPVAVVIGTRPEAVKLARIVRLLGERASVVHTGQHYDPELAGRFDAQLGLPEPVVQLSIGGGTRDEQLRRGERGLRDAFSIIAPAAVVVQGDTNSTLAGARAAASARLPLVHVEAGLRSFDLDMPEEHNRVETDHLSDLCLAPTEHAARNLADVGISPERVVVTGNTAVDAVLDVLPPEAARRDALGRLGLEAGRYVLATVHRPENTDDPHVLRTVLDALSSLPFPTVLPLHPRTAERAARAGVADSFGGLRIVPPLGHAAFLALAAEAAVIVSDSGGIQEEASVLKRPVVVVRRSTERPEVQGTFARLVPADGIGAAVTSWLDELRLDPHRLERLPSPYGSGQASERCVAALDGALLGMVRP
jgi:UDP-N-acetylglucosamine 2-epimerase (non-hydrolysing)